MKKKETTLTEVQLSEERMYTENTTINILLEIRKTLTILNDLITLLITPAIFTKSSKK